MKRYAIPTILAVLLFLPFHAIASNQDIAFLQRGVEKIGFAGSPGPICVFGDRAFAVVAGDQKDVQVPLTAAARYGQGRVVAFGHNGYVTPPTMQQADTLAFFKNCIQWTANEKKTPVVGVFKNKKLTSFLVEKKIDARDTDLNLKSIDVLIVKAELVHTRNLKAIDAFVADGGGLITAGLGWGWKQLNRGKDLRHDFAANQLLAPMGLVWADGYAGKTCNEGYLVKTLDDDLLNASRAFEQVVSTQKTNKPPTNAKQINATLTLAIRSLPEDDTIFLPKIAQIENQRDGAIVPSPKKPLKEQDVIGRLLVSQQMQKIQKTSPEKITAHPAAEFFPGSVPAEAKRVPKTLEIDTSVPRWHSTGLYAAPGETIIVNVDPTVAGKKLNVRIGAHKDKIWHHNKWKRCPDVTRSFAIADAKTVAANAFGGLVYIEVPKNCTLGAVKVDIGGAVEAPLYVHGKTDLKDWQTIRNAPGPWAELATDKIIITVPSVNVRTLDDPAALMDVWDDILDACADLATISRDRQSPERIVPDVQISAGYMHSGYPIMTHADQYGKLVDCEHLLKGSWGLFHELGHNHQNRDWTFGGTGEVTVNLFTTYVYETVCGTPPAKGRVPLERRTTEYEKYVAGGRDFDYWKSKPFLGLVMYLQLQEEFGWDAYKKVFAEYRALDKNERPKSDSEKRNQWMVRFSKAVGQNLGPFFDAWNVPVSDEAKKQIAHLPVWLPANFKTAKKL